MMDLDDDGPLKMEEGDEADGGDDYVLPRPPSPGGLVRTFTPDYGAPPTPSAHTPHHHHGGGRHHPGVKHPHQQLQPPSAAYQDLPHPAASPFPSTMHHPRGASMGPPPAPMRSGGASGGGGRELKRGYAINGGNYFPDESPSDVMAFPPPTPYKGIHHMHVPPSVSKPSHHHHHHHQRKGDGQGGGGGQGGDGEGGGGGRGGVSRFQADFDVVSVIGAGSFGEVYQARSRVDGVEYAVKCTRRRFKGQADRDRYLQEVKGLAKVCASDSSEEVLHVVRYHQAWYVGGGKVGVGGWLSLCFGCVLHLLHPPTHPPTYLPIIQDRGRAAVHANGAVRDQPGQAPGGRLSHELRRRV